MPEVNTILKTTDSNPTPQSLILHLKKVHPKIMSKFYEATKSKRKRKRLWFPEEGPFICTECQENFESSDTLKSHWDKVCNLKTKSTVEKLCNLCGKTFQRNSHLKKHVRSIHEKIPYDCTECDQSFATEDSSKNHMWNEHKIGEPRSHICNICGKTIKGGQAIFKQHIRETHQGIKNHKCDLCGASFSRPTGLRYHTQLVHENSGKYACSYCDFKTVIPKHLDIHVNSVHTKAIKYSCEDCNFSCYRKDGLTQHIKQVHLKLKRHHCTVCPEAYMRRSDFEKHKAITGH